LKALNATVSSAHLRYVPALKELIESELTTSLNRAIASRIMRALVPEKE
jgi:hypothetical protein